MALLLNGSGNGEAVKRRHYIPSTSFQADLKVKYWGKKAISLVCAAQRRARLRRRVFLRGKVNLRVLTRSLPSGVPSGFP